MFGGAPLFGGAAAGDNGPLPPPNADSKKLVEAIRDQTEGTPPHLVYVIDIVSVRFGGYFTAQVRAELERYRYLQMLTLNDCGVVSLENFPDLPALIRIDMVFNQVPGEHLQYLSRSKHLQTIMMGANKIEKIEHLNPLKRFKSLLQLDLLNNPVVRQPGYRAKVFSMFPSLSILDTLDKIGKDAYNNNTMMEAVSRIPDALFDKSPPPPPSALPPVHAVVHREQKKKLKKALSRTGSLDRIPKKPAVAPVRGKGAAKRVQVKAGKSRASKAGLVFPVGRVKRMLRGVMVGQRVGIGSAVYLSAVLQYLTAEMLQVSGMHAKREHKRRITPAFIKECIVNDEQIKRVLQNVTIRMSDE